VRGLVVDVGAVQLETHGTAGEKDEDQAASA
jgi:hypothetical protein